MVTAADASCPKSSARPSRAPWGFPWLEAYPTDWEDPPFTRRARWVAIWVVALTMADIHMFDSHAEAQHQLVVICLEAVALSVGLVDSFSPDSWWQRQPLLLLIGSTLTLWGISAALTVIDGSGWLYLIVFAIWPTIRARRPYAQMVLPLSALVTAGIGMGVGEPVGNLIGNVGTVLGCGTVVFGFSRLIRANKALREAQEERAVVAVSEERMRFARDLHDLLGHSLSVIALKSELAGRLLKEAPQEASEEVAEIERVARGALREVREAVTGYRRPTLAVELAGARTALAAAGIAWQVDGGDTDLTPEVEGVLAWCVREGVTNVIRHSEAQTCTIRVMVDSESAAVAVTDDGVGSDSQTGHGLTAGNGLTGDNGYAGNGHTPGNGLAGLAERVAAVGGVMEAAGVPTGGYRLRVSVPRTRAHEDPASPAVTRPALR